MLAVQAQERQWTVEDGLPTGEVHQIVELPNGQMLVNCEGVFCLSNGKGFQTVPCDYGRAYMLPHFSTGYAQQWQGDSLLWLRDFYRVFLFDARSRSFRYDVERNITKTIFKNFQLSSLVVPDRQGGLWQGTTQNGILYTPPKRQKAELIEGDNPLIDREIFKKKDVTVAPVKDYPIDAVYGKKLSKPQDYTDVRGQVVADYQDMLEKNWVAQLRQRYKFEVNKNVLATVNKH